MTPEEYKRISMEERIKVNVTLGFIILGIVLLFYWGGCFDNSKKQDQPKKVSHDAIDALSNTHQFVKQQLHAPATADFDYDDKNVTKLNDSTFSVISFVDAENLYGAKVRINYSCTIIFSYNNMVYCNDLNMVQQ